MIHIGKNSFRLNQIADDWADRLNIFLTSTGHRYSVYYDDPNNPKRKLKETCTSYREKMLAQIRHSSIPDNEKPIGIACINRFCATLNYYAKASSEDMFFIQRVFDILFVNQENVKNLLSDIFVKLYEDFTSHTPKNLIIPIAYYFLEKLGVRTCPYCNRTFTFSIHGEKKKVRPEFDHFYDKAQKPLLAVSFYNLIPSCPICNHAKRTNSLHFNPYFSEFKGKFKIYSKSSTEKEPAKPLVGDELFHIEQWGDIQLETPDQREIEDMKVLGVDELYKMHNDYVRDIVEKAQAYSDPIKEALTSTFQGIGHSPQQVFDFVWGKNLDTARHINHPLSKLTRDILEQLNIIKDDYTTN